LVAIVAGRAGVAALVALETPTVAVLGKGKGKQKCENDVREHVEVLLGEL
jgi:hypothetical protein